MSAVIPGFLLGLSLIVAIGAQNVFVLRQGLRREHVGVVVAICVVSDAVLILVGVGGLDRLESAAPWIADTARWAGAAFLLGYAVLAVRRAADADAEGLAPEPSGGEAAGGPVAGRTSTATRVAPVAATAVALTWLNPHVYLDTVFLLGSLASTHGDDRWFFAGGAVLASTAWFTTLGLGARAATRLLRTPTSWRVLDAAIAGVMVLMALKLALG
ncbi:amino acid transporter [Aeromicrobium sp. Root495]|uniref:LysE/ArgO family amino acid transporter n=1 Tax=Aeromicrobium sp. Root495 TaxID=1736550 RepID=UPI000701CAE1|nr:LysE family transporter [Aeromicrobium sp. Root495]KQY60685.1 amino acid transporter [Aeromicrobium sp. Root495]